MYCVICVICQTVKRCSNAARRMSEDSLLRDDLLQGSFDPIASQPVSVASLLRLAKSAPRFLCGRPDIDSLFKPSGQQSPASIGLPAGHTLQISGPPGEGKSRLCAGYAIRCRLRDDGSLDDSREALIIGTFSKALLHVGFSSCF